MVGDVFSIEREPSNPHDSMATAVKKEGQIVGHLPKSLTQFASFFLLKKDSVITCEVTGCRLNRGVGLALEVPCVYHFSGRDKYIKKLRALLTQQ